MSGFGGRTGLVALSVLALGAIALTSPVSAAGAAPSCASGSGPRAPVPVPEALIPDVAKAFDIPVEAARDGAFIRCAGDKLLACIVGANLNCGLANRRRSLRGATAFCRATPDSDFIPMAATGHDTIYEWRCAGQRAVAGKALVAVDAEGYVADNWRELR